MLAGVLVGSGYLHALKLVSWLVCPWFVLVRVPWLVWLPAYLEPRVLGLCVPGSCAWLEVVTCMP